MIATTKRHPSIVRHRTGVTRDGRLMAMDVEVHPRRRRVRHALACGPLARRDPRRRAVPLRQRADRRPRDVHQHAAQRRLPRLRRAADPVRRRSPHGAHRRGARPRSGATAGAEPAPGRRYSPPPGSVCGEDCSALEVLRTAVRRSGFRRKRKAYAGSRRGIGLALYWHGSGFTGSGELKLASRATVELTRQRADPGAHLEHRDRPGYPHDARADRRRRARDSVRAGRGPEPGHQRRAGQRTHGRVAHLHGGGTDPAASGGGDPRHASAT